MKIILGSLLYLVVTSPLQAGGEVNSALLGGEGNGNKPSSRLQLGGAFDFGGGSISKQGGSNIGGVMDLKGGSDATDKLGGVNE